MTLETAGLARDVFGHRPTIVLPNMELRIPRLLRQLMSFSGIGGIATLIHYVILVLLVQLVGVNPVLGSFIGFLISALVNYSLNYHWTFSSSKPHTEAAWKFFVVAAIGLALNTLIMSLAVAGFGIHYFAAQLVATAIVLMWTFSGNRLWTFG